MPTVMGAGWSPTVMMRTQLSSTVIMEDGPTEGKGNGKRAPNGTGHRTCAWTGLAQTGGTRRGSKRIVLVTLTKSRPIRLSTKRFSAILLPWGDQWLRGPSFLHVLSVR